MPQIFKNNAYGSLAADISAISTVISLGTGQGARFPSPAGGDYFLATLILLDSNGNETAWEIVKVTSRATDGLTVVRAQEGTTALTWVAGNRIEMRLTAGALSNFSTGSGGIKYLNTAGSLVVNSSHYLDSSGGSFSAYMPASPSVGDILIVSDISSSWSSNPVTLLRNGLNFVDQYGNGQAEDFVLNVSGMELTFIYTASGWRAS